MYFKRVRLGLESAVDEVIDRSKKPRPIDLINEKVMIGKYGPQQYYKKDYLRIDLIG